MMTTSWPNILWQNIIAQLNISCHEHHNIFWGQLNVLLVYFTIQIKRGGCSEIWGNCDAGSQRALHLTAEWPSSAILVFTTTTPEPKQTGRSTGFWVAIQFVWHNNSVRCIGGFKQFKQVCTVFPRGNTARTCTPTHSRDTEDCELPTPWTYPDQTWPYQTRTW